MKFPAGVFPWVIIMAAVALVCACGAKLAEWAGWL